MLASHYSLQACSGVWGDIYNVAKVSLNVSCVILVQKGPPLASSDVAAFLGGP